MAYFYHDPVVIICDEEGKMKRPLAYITAPWGDNEFENTEKEAGYCSNYSGEYFAGEKTGNG